MTKNEDKSGEQRNQAASGATLHSHPTSRLPLLSAVVRGFLFSQLCGAILCASAAKAQVATVDPGMTREQVIAKLGQPLSARTFEGHTYLLYKNGCEKTCGMNDLVVLDSNKVVDAVFRSPNRKYSGKSSSPVMITPLEARKGVGAPSKPSPPPTTKKPKP
jgi:hypothetical protein